MTHKRVRQVRLWVGTGVSVLGVLSLIVLLPLRQGDAAVAAAALLMTGLFILGHNRIANRWKSLTEKDPTLRLDGSGVVALAGAFITAPGAIIGLLSSFGTATLTNTGKVGLVTLAAELLLSFTLFGLVVTQKPDKSEPNGSMLFEIRKAIGSGGLTVHPASNPLGAESGDHPLSDEDEAIGAFRTYFFHLVIWTYAFGILCVVLSRVLP